MNLCTPLSKKIITAQHTPGRINFTIFYIVLVGTGTYIVLNTVQRRVNPTKIKDFAGREKNYILSRLFSSSKCSEGWE